MVQFSTLLVALVAAAVSVHAAPIQKRIAQDTPSAGLPFEQACDAAGGGQQCNPIKVSAIATLLAAAGACDQQDAADQMIDFAKQSLNSDQATIDAAVTFSQQPRNSPTSEKVLYCNKAPKNQELQGTFQCQFQGTKDTFVGGLQPGAAGTVPFGQTTVNPAGSCPLNPAGPIPDGQQLSDILKSSGGGTAASGAASGASSAAAASTAAGTDNSASGTAAAADTTAAAATSAAAAADTSSAAAPASTAAASSTSTTTSGNFQVQNGKDAQALNTSFQSLTADSTCTAGQNACVGADFAQCVGGKFVTTPCGSGLQCSALPLVNSAGTSITCTTAADTQSRIQNALNSGN